MTWLSDLRVVAERPHEGCGIDGCVVADDREATLADLRAVLEAEGATKEWLCVQTEGVYYRQTDTAHCYSPSMAPEIHSECGYRWVWRIEEVDSE